MNQRPRIFRIAVCMVLALVMLLCFAIPAFAQGEPTQEPTPSPGETQQPTPAPTSTPEPTPTPTPIPQDVVFLDVHIWADPSQEFYTYQCIPNPDEVPGGEWYMEEDPVIPSAFTKFDFAGIRMPDNFSYVGSNDIVGIMTYKMRNRTGGNVGTGRVIFSRMPAMKYSFDQTEFFVASEENFCININCPDSAKARGPVDVKLTVTTSTPLLSVSLLGEHQYAWIQVGNIGKIAAGATVGTVTFRLDYGAYGYPPAVYTCTIKKSLPVTSVHVNMAAFNRRFPSGVPTGESFNLPDFLSMNAGASATVSYHYEVLSGGASINYYSGELSTVTAHTPGPVVIRITAVPVALGMGDPDEPTYSHQRPTALLKFNVVGDAKTSTIRFWRAHYHLSPGSSQALLELNYVPDGAVPTISIKQSEPGVITASPYYTNGKWDGRIMVSAHKEGKVLLTVTILGQPVSCQITVSNEKTEFSYDDYDALGWEDDMVGWAESSATGKVMLARSGESYYVNEEGKIGDINVLGVRIELTDPQIDGNVVLNVLGGNTEAPIPREQSANSNAGLYMLLGVVACGGALAVFAKRKESKKSEG
ncbi:hypothetical protein LJC55_02770 [Eubacteriales bacterium OttesenSCG-928-N14]|nr:hypothetical protein [Eubacteriales bacterium OttesenSCG-928-N14]